MCTSDSVQMHMMSPYMYVVQQVDIQQLMVADFDFEYESYYSFYMVARSSSFVICGLWECCWNIGGSNENLVESFALISLVDPFIEYFL